MQRTKNFVIHEPRLSNAIRITTSLSKKAVLCPLIKHTFLFCFRCSRLYSQSKYLFSLRVVAEAPPLASSRLITAKLPLSLLNCFKGIRRQLWRQQPNQVSLNEGRELSEQRLVRLCRTKGMQKSKWNWSLESRSPARAPGLFLAL